VNRTGNSAGPVTSPPAPWISEESVWQLVECGSYRVDLPHWEQLAAGVRGPVLDLGCGTGRVSRHLAGRGIRTVGVELDAGIAADFNRMAAPGLSEVVVGDVLDLASVPLPFERCELIIAPQQLIQIIGGAEARRRLLAGAASRLLPGGRIALALSPDLPDLSVELDLLPDQREVAGWLYSSRPVSIEASPGWIEVTRLRERVSPAGEHEESAVVTAFERLEPARLVRELSLAGLAPSGTAGLPETAEHVASLIVTATAAP